MLVVKLEMENDLTSQLRFFFLIKPIEIFLINECLQKKKKILLQLSLGSSS